ncbi:MAG: hypothetical protein CO126_05480 [Hydrogenophilales bacterium CG_4_9_14_3_um_filter_63_34]|nr:MAG: hypothetical protein COZ24_13980 [Hydrogenophilales bacterium CG_4_10_14_3_um_filter_63_21]PJB04317.1 MAG: hypothetical protein CO126_05480 [Hydrogenophilales bacterium CG_4_9_14_3_um_filter_63_34]
MKSFLFSRIALPLALAGLPILAQAGTQAEYRALNAWCIGQLASKAGAGKTPYAKVTVAPRDNANFEHYCEAYGGVQIMYGVRDAGRKGTILAAVQTHLQFLIDALSADHYLLPEVYALLGKALYLNNHPAEAEIALHRALQLDPQHAAVYATLADIYVDSKRRALAEEAIRTGLALDPGSKKLRRVARRLGIPIPPTPKPQKADGVKPIKEEAAPSKPDTAAAKGEAVTAPKAPDSAEIGSPTNPFCRFCTSIPPSYPATSPSTPGVVPKAE